MPDHILLVGASARAMAASAMRAGMSPWCVDLFADADLAQACPVRRVAFGDYPRGLTAVLDEAPAGPWTYGGGLENFPDLLSTPGRELWGNAADVVRTVRDPRRLADALADFDPPRLADRPESGRWLVKPLRGSGGIGVRDWRPGSDMPVDCFGQELIAGVPGSAVFVGREGVATLLGATRQLVGRDWLHVPGPFQYAGSIGPIEPPERLVEMGQALVDEFGLRGLFGVDFIFDGERARPIEVNPRYPASLEILERATRRPLFALHAAAFRPSRLVPIREMAHRADRSDLAATIHGKAIYYAPADFTVPENGPWNAGLAFRLSDLDVPFADIPPAGARIARGEPVVTLFASGETVAACEEALRRIASEIDRLFGARR